jgi:hypothetical protein
MPHRVITVRASQQVGASGGRVPHFEQVGALSIVGVGRLAAHAVTAHRHVVLIVVARADVSL